MTCREKGWSSPAAASRLLACILDGIIAFVMIYLPAFDRDGRDRRDELEQPTAECRLHAC